MDLFGTAATATDVISVDAYVDRLVLSNSGGTARLCVVSDKASSPNAVLTETVAANTARVFDLGGMKFEGGINLDLAHAEMVYSITGSSAKV